jgi:hypothetical protein
MVFLASCLIQFPLSFVKISILLFYKRIFPTPIFKKCVWVAIGVVAVWGVLLFFVGLVRQPVFKDDSLT